MYNLLTTLTESKAHRIVGILSILLFILGLYLLGSYLPFLAAKEKTIPLMARTILFLVLLSTGLGISLLINLHFQKEYLKSTFLFEDNGVKWRVTNLNNGTLQSCYIPYCIEHDMPYFLTPGGQYMCREMIGSNCTSKIIDKDEVDFLISMAMPKVESLAHKYKTKC
ncbi:MAG: hypothetical protein P1P81_05100 [Desulfobulbales bacterium]|nr:hypothetical protein [Desulfobulbales bacterium]